MDSSKKCLVFLILKKKSNIEKSIFPDGVYNNSDAESDPKSSCSKQDSSDCVNRVQKRDICVSDSINDLGDLNSGPC